MTGNWMLKTKEKANVNHAIKLSKVHIQVNDMFRAAVKVLKNQIMNAE